MTDKKSETSLTILSGERAGEQFTLKSDQRYVVGRDRSADISLPEKKISRRHAAFYFESNHLWIEDLNSLNGSFVNGVLIQKPQRLKNKDRLQIGSHLLQVNSPEKAASDESSILDLGRTSASVESISRAPVSKGAQQIETFRRSFQETGDVVEEQTGGRLISGKLQELALTDLLQMLATTKKTGRLVISDQKYVMAPRLTGHEDVGNIYLKDGDVVYASYKNMENEEAFYQTLRKHEGYFALFPHQDFNFQKQIEMPLEGLIMEGIRRLDEETANTIDFGPKETFEIHLEESLTELGPEELRLFQVIMKQKRFDKIMQSTSFDEKRAKTIIRDLIKKGFLSRKS